MKLISRKSLVAVACSAAMITGATVAPAMAADAPATTTNNAPTISSDFGKFMAGSSDTKEKKKEATTGNNAGKNESSSPAQMGEWAKAIAAVISTLTAIWTFVQKFLLKK